MIITPGGIAPKLSIIVPAYNAEITLPNCLDSILGQTMTDFEVIIIVQTCSDKTLDIAQEYATKDNRIRVFTSNKRGEGLARNSGLNRVKGEFFGFVDADDTISENMYETLYKAIITNEADIAMCEFDYEMKNRNSILWRSFSYHAPIANDIIRMRPFVYGEKAPFSRNPITCNVVWNKLYRSSTLGQLRIPVEQTFSVDRCFNAEAFSVAKKICYVPESLYQYRNYDNSLSRRSTEDEILSGASVCHYLTDLAKRYLQPKEVFEAVDAHYMSIMKSVLLRKIRQGKKDLHLVLNDKHFRDLLVKYPPKHKLFQDVTFRGKVVMFFIRRRCVFALKIIFKLYFMLKNNT